MLERIQKIIAGAGVASRRKAEEMINDFRVTVNGQIVKIGDKADLEKDDIRVDGKDIQQNRRVYLAFYKPVGCLVSTTSTAATEQKTIYDVAKFPEKVFYVGRLDFNSEGLLLMTNDGAFSNRVTHPSFNTQKTYVVGVSKEPEQQDLDILNKGVSIDERLVEAAVRVVGDKKIEVTLHEGRKHIVKRLLGKLGYGVFSLKRTRIGNLTLGSLKPGQWRELSPSEVEDLVRE